MLSYLSNQQANAESIRVYDSVMSVDRNSQNRPTRRQEDIIQSTARLDNYRDNPDTESKPIRGDVER
jgi:hypothetical protein